MIKQRLPGQLVNRYIQEIQIYTRKRHRYRYMYTRIPRLKLLDMNLVNASTFIKFNMQGISGAINQSI